MALLDLPNTGEASTDSIEKAEAQGGNAQVEKTPSVHQTVTLSRGFLFCALFPMHRLFRLSEFNLLEEQLLNSHLVPFPYFRRPQSGRSNYLLGTRWSKSAVPLWICSTRTYAKKAKEDSVVASDRQTSAPKSVADLFSKTIKQIEAQKVKKHKR